MRRVALEFKVKGLRQIYASPSRFSGGAAVDACSIGYDLRSDRSIVVAPLQH